MPARFILVSSLFTLMALSTAKAQDLSQMSAEQLRSTGLAKLDAAERAALQNWLNTQQKVQPSANVPTAVPEGNAPGSININAIAPMTAEAPTVNYPEAESARKAVKREAFDAELSAEITELTGTTRIRLTNGQVWQQVNSDQWRGSLSDLRVRIKPKFGGSWLMQFKANNLSIRVKRIE